MAKMDPGQIVQRVGKIFFIVPKFAGDLRKRDVLCVMRGNVGDNLLV